MTISPLCLVQDGAGSFVGTLNGVNVTEGNVVSIKLDDITGVTDWYLQVTGTDETTTPPSLVNVNPVDNKVATPSAVVSFTVPFGAGRAYLFQTTVTGPGGPLNSTFTLYLLTDHGHRVGSTGEQREGNATHGWVTITNPLVRRGAPVIRYDDTIQGPASGSNTVQGALDWLKTQVGTAGGDLSGSYPNPTVVGLLGIPIFGTPGDTQTITYNLAQGRFDWGAGGGGGGTLAGDVTGPSGTNVVSAIRGIPSPDPAFKAEGAVFEAHNAGLTAPTVTFNFPYCIVADSTTPGVFYVGNYDWWDYVPTPTLQKFTMSAGVVTAVATLDFSLIDIFAYSVMDLAEDANYVYVSLNRDSATLPLPPFGTENGGYVAIVSKATFQVVGWATVSAQPANFYSVCADNAGNFYVHDGASNQISKYLTANHVGAVIGNGIPAVATEVGSYPTFGICFGGGKIWANNQRWFGYDVVRQYDTDLNLTATLADFDNGAGDFVQSLNAVYDEVHGALWIRGTSQTDPWPTNYYKVEETSPGVLAVTATAYSTGSFVDGAQRMTIFPSGNLIVLTSNQGPYVGLISTGSNSWAGTYQTNTDLGINYMGVACDATNAYVVGPGYGGGAGVTIDFLTSTMTYGTIAPIVYPADWLLRYATPAGDVTGGVGNSLVSTIRGITSMDPEERTDKAGIELHREPGVPLFTIDWLSPYASITDDVYLYVGQYPTGPITGNFGIVWKITISGGIMTAAVMLDLEAAISPFLLPHLEKRGPLPTAPKPERVWHNQEARARYEAERAARKAAREARGGPYGAGSFIPGVLEFTQDANYIYAALDYGEHVAIISKATFHVVGWAWIGNGAFVNTVALDGNGNLYAWCGDVWNGDGYDNGIYKWVIADVIADGTPFSVGSVDQLTGVWAYRLCFGGGWLWGADGDWSVARYSIDNLAKPGGLKAGGAIALDWAVTGLDSPSCVIYSPIPILAKADPANPKAGPTGFVWAGGWRYFYDIDPVNGGIGWWDSFSWPSSQVWSARDASLGPNSSGITNASVWFTNNQSGTIAEVDLIEFWNWFLPPPQRKGPLPTAGFPWLYLHPVLQGKYGLAASTGNFVYLPAYYTGGGGGGLKAGGGPPEIDWYNATTGESGTLSAEISATTWALRYRLLDGEVVGGTTKNRVNSLANVWLPQNVNPGTGQVLTTANPGILSEPSGTDWDEGLGVVWIADLRHYTSLNPCFVSYDPFNNHWKEYPLFNEIAGLEGYAGLVRTIHDTKYVYAVVHQGPSILGAPTCPTVAVLNKATGRVVGYGYGGNRPYGGMALDDKGHLWITTSNGLEKYTIANLIGLDDVASSTPDATLNIFLTAWDVVFDGKWLYVSDPDNWRVSQIDPLTLVEFDGYWTSASPFGMLIRAEGDLWVACDTQVIRINTGGMNLQATEFLGGEYWGFQNLAYDGTQVWAATWINGWLYSFYPAWDQLWNTNWNNYYDNIGEWALSWSPSRSTMWIAISYNDGGPPWSAVDEWTNFNPQNRFTGPLFFDFQTPGSDPIMGRDISGTASWATVTQIQNYPITAGLPATGSVLTFNGSSWAGAATSGGGFRDNGTARRFGSGRESGQYAVTGIYISAFGGQIYEVLYDPFSGSSDATSLAANRTSGVIYTTDNSSLYASQVKRGTLISSLTLPRGGLHMVLAGRQDQIVNPPYYAPDRYIFVSSTSGLQKVDVKYSAAMTVVNSTATSTGSMVFDGQYVWALNLTNNCINRINNATGAGSFTETLFTSPGSISNTASWIGNRMAFDGRYLWVIDNNYYGPLRKIDTQAAPYAPVTSYNLPAGSYPVGIAFDGHYLWVGTSSSQLLRIDPTAADPGVPVDTYTYSGVGTNFALIYFNGAHLLVGTTNAVDSWFIVDPDTGKKIASYAVSGSPGVRTAGAAIQWEGKGAFIAGTASSGDILAEKPLWALDLSTAVTNSSPKGEYPSNGTTDFVGVLPAANQSFGGYVARKAGGATVLTKASNLTIGKVLKTIAGTAPSFIGFHIADNHRMFIARPGAMDVASCDTVYGFYDVLPIVQDPYLMSQNPVLTAMFMYPGGDGIVYASYRYWSNLTETVAINTRNRSVQSLGSWGSTGATYFTSAYRNQFSVTSGDVYQIAWAFSNYYYIRNLTAWGSKSAYISLAASEQVTTVVNNATYLFLGTNQGRVYQFALADLTAANPTLVPVNTYVTGLGSIVGMDIAYTFVYWITSAGWYQRLIIGTGIDGTGTVSLGIGGVTDLKRMGDGFNDRDVWVVYPTGMKAIFNHSSGVPYVGLTVTCGTNLQKLAWHEYSSDIWATDATEDVAYITHITGTGIGISAGTPYTLALGGLADWASATATSLQEYAVSATAPTTGYSLVWNGSAWTPTAPTSLAGDVTGSPAANTVVKLQNRTLAATAPTAGQHLAWNAGTTQWEPTTDAGAPAVGWGTRTTSHIVGQGYLPLNSASGDFYYHGNADYTSFGPDFTWTSAAVYWATVDFCSWAGTSYTATTAINGVPSYPQTAGDGLAVLCERSTGGQAILFMTNRATGSWWADNASSERATMKRSDLVVLTGISTWTTIESIQNGYYMLVGSRTTSQLAKIFVDGTLTGSVVTLPTTGNMNVPIIPDGLGYAFMVAGGTLYAVNVASAGFDGTHVAAVSGAPTNIGSSYYSWMCTDGTYLYVPDSTNNVIHVITLATRVWLRSFATAASPRSVSFDGVNLWYADTGSTPTIRVVSTLGAVIGTVGTTAPSSTSWCPCFNGRYMYYSGSGGGNGLWAFDVETRTRNLDVSAGGSFRIRSFQDSSGEYADLWNGGGAGAGGGATRIPASREVVRANHLIIRRSLALTGHKYGSPYNTSAAQVISLDDQSLSVLAVRTRNAPTTIYLPRRPVDGMEILIHDAYGNAASQNITVYSRLIANPGTATGYTTNEGAAGVGTAYKYWDPSIPDFRIYGLMHGDLIYISTGPVGPTYPLRYRLNTMDAYTGGMGTWNFYLLETSGVYVTGSPSTFVMKVYETMQSYSAGVLTLSNQDVINTNFGFRRYRYTKTVGWSTIEAR